MKWKMGIDEKIYIKKSTRHATYTAMDGKETEIVFCGKLKKKKKFNEETHSIT
eukprot:m.140657 g.140657  ORF g.140657 m.140657 type:complete len:53 (-) comp32150_c0_seq1:69-227(-)